jgi:N-acetylglucosamine-6-sulfatase
MVTRRRTRYGRPSVAVAFRGLLVVFALVACLLTLPAPAVAQPEEPPSVVFIITDDQRWDTLGVMPTVQSELVARGVTFTNAFVVNALCCPSRASILTGRYSHSTGVYANRGTHGGFHVFDDSSTIATWLQARGYRTGLIGKYLNRYDGAYIPPGWDRWVAFSGKTAYFGYKLNVDGTLVPFGDATDEYSTDVLGRAAADFIRSASGPLFLHFSPFAPHSLPGNGRQTRPAPRHEGAFAGIEPWRPPSYNERDISDKPPWLQRFAPLPLTPEEQAAGDAYRRSQLESLLAVDDAVEEILAALTETGRLENTMIVFTSDNGLGWGEHRWFTKTVPYEESIRVPLVLRYDPLTAVARSDARIALNIDFAPTAAEIAGVDAPGADGHSLLPLLSPPPITWRRDFLVEHIGFRDPAPTYCAVRNAARTYVQYRSGFEELYDLSADAYQRWNRARNPSRRRTIVTFRNRIRSLCKPPPPGFTPRSPCLVLGDDRANLLRGTPYYDLVCARAGSDRVTAGAGGDRVLAGEGSDLVYGQWGNDLIYGRGRLGKDRLYGGDGDDTIWADDVRSDVVACGAGFDIATVDRLDRFHACEVVRRR